MPMLVGGCKGQMNHCCWNPRYSRSLSCLQGYDTFCSETAQIPAAFILIPIIFYCGQMQRWEEMESRPRIFTLKFFPRLLQEKKMSHNLGCTDLVHLGRVSQLQQLVKGLWSEKDAQHLPGTTNTSVTLIRTKPRHSPNVLHHS